LSSKSTLDKTISPNYLHDVLHMHARMHALTHAHAHTLSTAHNGITVNVQWW